MRSSMTRRRFLAAAAGAMATESFPQALGAGQATSDDRVRIVTGLRATNQSLGWIGTEAGIFKRLGLEVAFPKLETGGPEAAAGLIRGDWEFAETGSSPLIQGVLDGHDTVILLTPTAPSPTGTTIILARPGISEPSQLNGMRIGVLTESGQTTISLHVSLRTWDVTATLIPLGTFGKIYAALGSGGIDAGTLPFDYRFLGPREFGLNVIETPSTGFSPAAVGGTRRLITATAPSSRGSCRDTSKQSTCSRPGVQRRSHCSSGSWSFRIVAQSKPLMTSTRRGFSHCRARPRPVSRSFSRNWRWTDLPQVLSRSRRLWTHRSSMNLNGSDSCGTSTPNNLGQGERASSRMSKEPGPVAPRRTDAPQSDS